MMRHRVEEGVAPCENSGMIYMWHPSTKLIQLGDLERSILCTFWDMYASGDCLVFYGCIYFIIKFMVAVTYAATLISNELLLNHKLIN